MTGALFVGNFLSSAGSNRTYSEELTDRLEQRGWRITRTSAHGGRVLRLADMMHTTFTRRRTYALAHVDVFSGAAFTWAEAVCFELRFLKKPYMLTLRGGNLPAFARRSQSRVRRLLRSAALVTAPSRYLEEQLSDYRRDIVVLRNAIDTTSYRYRERSTLVPRLVWVRAFHDIYNPTLAIEVLAIISRRYPAATLKMVGPDKDGSRSAVEARAKELGVADRLELIGGVPKSEVSTHLSEGDIFLNTTTIDNAPISLLEAMAAGLCVVSTAVGGIPHLVEHGRTALLVPSSDADAMSASVLQLLDDPALATKLSTSARAFAMTCDWAVVLDEWEEMLGQLAV